MFTESLEFRTTSGSNTVLPLVFHNSLLAEREHDYSSVRLSIRSFVLGMSHRCRVQPCLPFAFPDFSMQIVTIQGHQIRYHRGNVKSS
jgi:hypothetical protein